MGKKTGARSAPRPPEAFTEETPLFGRRATLISILIIVGVWMVFFWRIIFLGEILTGGDVLAGAAIFERYAQERLAAGEFPLWNPYIFSGMPFFESMTWNGVVYPTYWLKLILEKIPGVELSRIFFLVPHYLLAGLGTFFFLRSRRIGHAGAVLGGLAFMLTPQLVGLSTIGHGGKVLTAAYIPLVLMAAMRLLETGERRWMAALALLGGLQFLGRHVQVSYFTWLLVGLFVVYQVVVWLRAGGAAATLGKRVAMLVGAGVLAAALAAILLVPLQQYTAFSTRVGLDGGMGFEQATMWSFHPKEIITFLVPSFFGLANDTYWGTMPFQQVSHALGYLVLCLAVIGAAVERDRTSRFLAIVFGVALFLAFGRHIGPVYHALYRVLPGFGRFRVPALFLLLVQFSGAALAGRGAAVVLGEIGRPTRKWLPWAIGTAAAGIVIGLVILGMRSNVALAAASSLMAKHAGVPASALRGVANRAAQMAFRDGGILLAFAAATGVAIFVAGTRRLAGWIAAALLIGIAVWELAIVDTRFLHPERMQPLEVYYPKTAAIDYIQRQPGVFRVAPVDRDFSSNALMYHGIESVGGYHPAKLSRYNDLITKHGVGNLKLLSMLNVGYVVGPEELDHPAFETVAPGVHRYLATLPRAFLIGDVRDEMADAVSLAEYGIYSFDPSAYANVAEKLPGPVGGVERGSVRIVSVRPEEIRVETRNEEPCLLVFSEVYYSPGWKAFVDGEETEIYRANYAFRSVYLDPGTHAVDMRYSSPALRWGAIVTLTAAALIALLWAVPRRKRPAGSTS